MLKIKFVDRVEDLSIFRDRKAEILAGVFTKTSELMIRLQAHVVTQKLSGQVLRRITGVLASSVQAQPTRVEGDRVIGEVTAGTGPSNVYAWTHELGGSHDFTIVPTKAKVLRFLSTSGEEIFRRSVHHPPLPARPFAEPSLDEMRETIVQEIQRAFDDALKS